MIYALKYSLGGNLVTVETAALAATVVSSFLVPYVKIGAEKLAETIGQNVGEQIGTHISNTAQKIWELVKSAFSSDEDKAILTQFTKRPDAAKQLIEDILKEKLEHNATLAQEMAALTTSNASDGKSVGAHISQAEIAGILDARGADFSGASNINLSGVQISGPSKLSSSDSPKNK